MRPRSHASSDASPRSTRRPWSCSPETVEQSIWSPTESTGPTCHVRLAQAGGRHEPDTRLRLLAAAISAANNTQAAARQADTDRLTEELGQQDLAVDGEVHTLQAIADHRVSMLFVDADTWADHTHIDETIRAAHADGATICPASVPDLADGVGALLRRAY